MTVCPCIAQYITDSFRSQSQNQPTGRGKDNRARGATGGRRYVLGLSQIPTLFAHTRLTLSFIYLSVRADFRETRRYLPAGFHQLPLPFRKTWGGGGCRRTRTRAGRGGNARHARRRLRRPDTSSPPPTAGTGPLIRGPWTRTRWFSGARKPPWPTRGGTTGKVRAFPVTQIPPPCGGPITSDCLRNARGLTRLTLCFTHRKATHVAPVWCATRRIRSSAKNVGPWRRRCGAFPLNTHRLHDCPYSS